MPARHRLDFLFLNLGHAIDHMFMLFYPTVVLALGPQFGSSYAELLSVSVFGFVAFGAGAIPAGWLSDRWSRKGMMVIFFIGIGVATMLVGLSQNIYHLGLGLTLVGLFASIYHPVGIAMVTEFADKLGKALGINGVFGNLGIAFAAVIAGALVDTLGWRWAFFIPGAVSVGIGLLYLAYGANVEIHKKKGGAAVTTALPHRRLMLIATITTIGGGLTFQAMTVALPKILTVRIPDLLTTTTQVGAAVTVIVTVAAFGQILIGYMIDRYPIRTIVMTIMACQLPAFLIVRHVVGVPLLGIALLVMTLVFMMIPIVDTIIARYTAPEYRARAYAVRFALNLGIGATAVPFVAGVHKLTGEFDAVFLTLAVVIAVILSISVMLPGEKPRHTAAQAAAAE